MTTNDDGLFLLGLIDDYRASRGWPSERSVARTIGVSSSTLAAWRARGISRLPDPRTIHALAELLGVPTWQVYDAAAVDAGYITAEEASERIADFEARRNPPRTTPAAG